MANLKLFVSYAHRDEQNSGGRLLDVARDISSEFELQTGEMLELFIDRDADSGIQWGEVWRQVIDSQLMQAAFYIPFLSPSFLKSAECRREFMEFHQASKNSDSEQLLMPILFVDIAANPSSLDDDVAKLASERQWIDFSTLRLKSRYSEPYIKTVNEMASRLATALRTMDSASLENTRNIELADPAIGDDAPGTADLIATSEHEIANAGPFIELFTDYLLSVGNTLQTATPGLKAAKSFAARVVAFRQIASQIDDDVSSMLDAASEFEASTAAADPGILTMFDTFDRAGAVSPDALSFSETVAETYRSIRDLADQSKSAQQQLAPLADQSRDLRPQVSAMNDAFQRIDAAAAFFEEWAHRAEQIIDRAT